MREGQVRLLGRVEVVGPAGVARLVGARQRAVVGLLGLRVGAVVPIWRMVDALWGDDPPRTAVRSLHSHVARVRQALEGCGLPDVLVTSGQGYVLRLAPAAVDAWSFEDSARRGREQLAAGACEQAAAELAAGLSLWRHESALADAEPTGWVAAEVDRLAEVRLGAVEDRWDAELRLGRHASAVGELERALVGHPRRERLVGLLMLALYRSGCHSAALEAYERLRASLAAELGVDPGAEIARLHTRILRREPELDPGPARPGAGLGLEPAPRPAQLPAPVGHFTGRAAELAVLDGLLDGLADRPPGGAGAETRVAVVSGPAGVGKTALAVQWAHRVADRFPDGQLYVDLRGHEPATALTPGDALAHVLRSLGVPADRIPATVAEQAGLYRSLLHGRRILVVLDNGGAADDILPLVPAGAGNLLLVTSRQAMAALATHHAICPVRLDVLAAAEALELLRRLLGTQATDAEPEATAELARLCGRLPLALRIAAAKLAGRAGTIGELAAELAAADRLDALALDGGSRSVRAVFASAYRALSPAAARLFRLLGLHPGPTFGTRLAAVLTGVPWGIAAEAVAELARAHLVGGAGPDRYRLHDLIQLFAHRCALADEPAPDRADAADRLVEWYLAVAAAANRAVDPSRDRVAPALRHPPAEPPFGTDRHAALAFLDSERDNLLPVVRYAAEHGRPTAAWQLTYLLAGFYNARGHWQERVEMCRWGVRAAEYDGGAGEALMRTSFGVACVVTGRYAEALDSLRQALPLVRAGGDPRDEGNVHNNIAAAHSGLRRFDLAIEAFGQALVVHSANRYPLGVAMALNNIGHTYVRMGRPELSFDNLGGALTASRRIGNRWLEAAVLHSLGEADLGCGEPDRARGHLGEALAIYRELGDHRHQVEVLNALGLADLDRDQPAAALDHLRPALALVREAADQHLEAVTLTNLGRAQLGAGDLAASREHLALALALRARAPDPYEEARLQHGLGDLADRAGNRTWAERHWGLAVGLYASANAQGEADRLTARLRGERGQPSLAAGGLRPVAPPGQRP